MQLKASSILWIDRSIFNLGKRMNEKEFRNLLAFSFKKNPPKVEKYQVRNST